MALTGAETSCSRSTIPSLSAGRRRSFCLPIKDKYFSRVHFLIEELNPPCCRLVDMASTNGTYVNGQRVTTIDLRDGDNIKGGKTFN